MTFDEFRLIVNCPLEGESKRGFIRDVLKERDKRVRDSTLKEFIDKTREIILNLEYPEDYADLILISKFVCEELEKELSSK